jgi:LEA14-like dessication related protein
LALVVLLTACSLVFTEPSIRVAGVRVASLGLTSGTAEVVLEVDNPNGYDLEVRGFDYRLQVVDDGAPDGWRELSAGEWPDTVRLPSRDTLQVTIPVPFDYTALGSALNAIMATGGVDYQVSGETRVGGPTGEYHVPFRQRGTLRP